MSDQPVTGFQQWAGELGNLELPPRPLLPNLSRVTAHRENYIHAGHWVKWTSPGDSGHPRPRLAAPEAEGMCARQLGSPAVGVHTWIRGGEGV